MTWLDLWPVFAFLFTLVVIHGAGIVWWASKIEGRVMGIEKQLDKIDKDVGEASGVSDRMARVEYKIDREIDAASARGERMARIEETIKTLPDVIMQKISARRKT